MSSLVEQRFQIFIPLQARKEQTTGEGSRWCTPYPLVIGLLCTLALFEERRAGCGGGPWCQLLLMPPALPPTAIPSTSLPARSSLQLLVCCRMASGTEDLRHRVEKLLATDASQREDPKLPSPCSRLFNATLKTTPVGRWGRVSGVCGNMPTAYHAVPRAVEHVSHSGQ